MQPGSDWPEIGEDALDPPRAAAGRALPWLPRRRPALGVRSTAAPTLLFVLLGVALGPHGAGVLSAAAIRRLDLVVSVALAVIGVFVGLGLASLRTDGAGRALVSGLAASAITIGAVSGGLYLLLRDWGADFPLGPLAFSTVLGICASVSAAAHVASDASPELRRAARLADLDDVPLVVLGVLAIAVLGEGAVPLRLLLTAAAGAAIGVAGWLLFEHAEGAAERGVFVAGAVLLLAGIGAYLRTSPLLCGCVAALVWVRAPGAADRITAADLRALQHPLVALLLIIAGAMVEWTAVVLWVASALVLLRLTGKLVASLTVAEMADVSPTLLATVLLPPGIMGIALAINVRQVLGPELGPLVSTVTTAAVASELLAMFLPHEQGER